MRLIRPKLIFRGANKISDSSQLPPITRTAGKGASSLLLPPINRIGGGPAAGTFHLPPVNRTGGSLINYASGQRIKTENYQRIQATGKRNIWVTGDLHGCYSRLMGELKRINFDHSQDLLISVGDLIDRGSENIKCLNLITQPWFKAVRGNHEQMMLDCLLGGGYSKHWYSNGGGWFESISSNEKEQIKRLLNHIAALPFVIEVVGNGKTVVICHADYPSNNYAFGKEVFADDVIWSRDRIERSQSMMREGKGSTVGAISGATHFFFGHTPLDAPLHVSNQHYIDTGAVFGKFRSLTLFKIKG